MALANNRPRDWNTLPDLEQLRASYYEALADPSMTIIGEQFANPVCIEG